MSAGKGIGVLSWVVERKTSNGLPTEMQWFRRGRLPTHGPANTSEDRNAITALERMAGEFQVGPVAGAPDSRADRTLRNAAYHGRSFLDFRGAGCGRVRGNARLCTNLLRIKRRQT